MRKFIALSILICGLMTHASAKDGYKITIKFKEVRDSAFFLAHYFAKPLPTIYKTDSGKLDKNGNAVLASTKKITGGMYLIMLSDRKTYFEFLLNNGDDIEVTINDVKSLPSTGWSVKNSVDNIDFLQYENFVKKVGDEHQRLMEQLTTAKNSIDSAAIKDKMTSKMKALIDFRNDFASKKPNSLLAKIFKGLELPKIPEGKHYLPDGKEDKDFAYQYYKKHYWENFDLKDGRMINTPIYDSRLSEYFEKLVIPVTDSMIKELDWILGETAGTGDLFNYTLSWLSNYTQDSKVMGMDRVYVYLVDKYYAKGKAEWLSSDLLQKHLDHARELGPTLIGNVGYDITMKDVNDKPVTVSNIKAKYKLIIMWDPACGHCQKEIPMIDSVYKAEKLKAKGLQLIGICTEDIVPTWKDFIEKHKLNDWIHLYDPEHKSNYKMMYNARVNPTIYLLDAKGIIRGKSIDHSNIGELIDMLERQEADLKKGSSK